MTPPSPVGWKFGRADGREEVGQRLTLDDFKPTGERVDLRSTMLPQLERMDEGLVTGVKDVNEQSHWQWVQRCAEKAMQQVAALIGGTVEPSRGENQTQWAVQVRDGTDLQTIVLFVSKEHPHRWHTYGVSSADMKAPLVKGEEFDERVIHDALNQVLSAYGKQTLL